MKIHYIFFFLLISISYGQEITLDSVPAPEKIKDTLIEQATQIVHKDSVKRINISEKIKDSLSVVTKDTLIKKNLDLVNKEIIVKPIIDTIQKDDVSFIRRRENDSTYVVIDTLDAKELLKIKFDKLKAKIQNVPDHDYAKNIDSLWLKDLYSNDLYATVNNIRLAEVTDTLYYPDLPKDTLINRLARLNDKTPFHIEYNPILHSVIKRFLKNRKKSLERLMALSEFYFPHFEKILDAHNMPLEIKYLAIVESALNPRAKSRVGATGLWQFMYPTGKEHGLDVNSYVDERSDLEKSTIAACEYLTRVYKRFGDWDLALASYNSGPGNVSKAIRRSGGHENYWNIRPFLPRETAGYVPIFQATMYVFEYAKEHNFKPEVPEVRYFETDTIRVRKKLGLEHVSQLFDIKMEDLQFLNPSYKLDIIPVVKGENYLLRLPKQYIGKFVSHENEIYDYAHQAFNTREKPLDDLVNTPNRIRYRVRKGDFLGKIARRYGVGVSKIKRWNGLKSNNLRIGQRLIIYPNHPIKVPKKKKSTNTSSSSSKTSYKTAGSYKVRSGDTLYGIAKKYPGVSADNIKQHNKLRSNSLKPGMILKIPKG
ncbi:lytic transglycosylase domain-containing protein [Pseudofulvibacter geojedonensis]|uniref:LysM peptidoglycan-binding domain-containing protein n=1 Tax=Pseudofulvibacter geojedonensis TaxID=1123758 RepID=A0ABW3I4R8_9FLAO